MDKTERGGLEHPLRRPLLRPVPQRPQLLQQSQNVDGPRFKGPRLAWLDGWCSNSHSSINKRCRKSVPAPKQHGQSTRRAPLTWAQEVGHAWIFAQTKGTSWLGTAHQRRRRRRCSPTVFQGGSVECSELGLSLGQRVRVGAGISTILVVTGSETRQQSACVGKGKEDSDWADRDDETTAQGGSAARQEEGHLDGRGNAHS